MNDLMETILVKAQKLSLIRFLDIHFARMLTFSSYSPALMLASACLSADIGAGHVCLPLKNLTPKYIFNGYAPLLAKEAWKIAGKLSISQWKILLLSLSPVSDGSCLTPLVLDKQNLYLYRMWQDECTIGKFFNKQHLLTNNINENKIIIALKRFFPHKNKNINWQKVAIAIMITRSMAIISGGPGTGKTTIIAKLLMMLIFLKNTKHLRIVLTAFTGTAVARLKEPIKIAMQCKWLQEEQKKYLPHRAITLHKLLNIQLKKNFIHYDLDNYLYLDVLIVDEASMISLSMMANIIKALPPHAQIFFLGDHNQLSSIEPGSILKDICQFFKSGYSFKRCNELKRLTGFILPINKNTTHHNITDSFCLLHKNYRLNSNSIIKKIAMKIAIGDAKKVLFLLKKNISEDLNYISLSNLKEYQQMINNCVVNYSKYLSKIHHNCDISTILYIFNQFRLLCVLREGPFGVYELNKNIESELVRIGLLNIKKYITNYVGQPIIITCNTPMFGLYNGDIGVILHDKNKILRAYFPLTNNTFKTFTLNQLPEYETAFAITVHKAQGLEFDRISLVLPYKVTPILTRELLYTAITRTCKYLSIYATDDILFYAILNKTLRRSGLFERLV